MNCRLIPSARRRRLVGLSPSVVDTVAALERQLGLQALRYDLRLYDQEASRASEFSGSRVGALRFFSFS